MQTGIGRSHTEILAEQAIEFVEEEIATPSIEFSHALDVAEEEPLGDEPRECRLVNRRGATVVDRRYRSSEKENAGRTRRPASLVDVQQRLNCALPSFLFEPHSLSFVRSSRRVAAGDQLIHPRDLAVDLFNRSRTSSSAMNFSLERR
jgi:hypothetical protein